MRVKRILGLNPFKRKRWAICTINNTITFDVGWFGKIRNIKIGKNVLRGAELDTIYYDEWSKHDSK